MPEDARCDGEGPLTGSSGKGYSVKNRSETQIAADF